MACSRRENRGFHRALCKAVEREGSRSNTQEVIKTEAPNCSPMCPLSTPSLPRASRDSCIQWQLHPSADSQQSSLPGVPAEPPNSIDFL